MNQGTKLLIVGVVVVGAGFLVMRRANAPGSTSSMPTASPSVSVQVDQDNIPLDHARDRITKKHFGTYVTPQNSPVQPERFTGYHTGTDFEILPGEEQTAIAVRTICNGTLLVKRFASGYGGIAVQACTINSQAVTVVYGHLKLSSVAVATGTQLSKGTQLGILGAPYSSETDGERKHLHLGIHRGSSINIAGYVQSRPQLSGWIDPESVLF